jgi:alanine racemase
VIKANAYGHGIVNAVQAFGRADGLAMLDLEEAVLCREAGWRKPILMLEGFFEPADIPVLDRYGLSTTLHCQEQIDMLLAAKPGNPIDAMVKLNTGMNRLGFSESDFRGAYRQAISARQQGILGKLGKMTHFACADDNAEATREQIRLFTEVTRDLPGCISLCNSAATLTEGLWASVPDTAEQWVRPGICLYGGSPFDDKTAADLGLRPAMTLGAQIISMRSVAPGAQIGYGYSFKATERMTIGVVACGYADGYPRHAPTGTPVSIDGVASRVLGRVSMDMLTVDLTHVPQARPGSMAVLWGERGPSIDDVARSAGTIGYELVCAVTSRVPRRAV